MKKENKKYLTCRKVIFYGITDEDMFFEWLKRIPCIINITGAGENLYLYVHEKPLSEDDIYELLSLFRRYNIDMTQLRSFLTEETRKFFSRSKDAYWYKPLFE